VDYNNVLTTCIYCGCGCGLYLQVLNGKVVGTLPAKGHAISEGKLCIKGWNAHDFVHHPDRLTMPLIRDRKGADLREATWDEALDLVASRLNQVKAEHGPDATGFLTSAKCTNEENYLLQKLARGMIGTNNVDHCARL
jgi:predicted molibdopterin-dependent oxidoreductase YjgC